MQRLGMFNSPCGFGDWNVRESIGVFEQAQLATAVPSNPSVKKSKSARI
jgi:hypothetical protein